MEERLGIVTEQTSLDFNPPSLPAGFDGRTYDPKLDAARLGRQLQAVRGLMLDGSWRSLHEIAQATGYPEASVSARLRDLRKLKFGALQVERRRRPGLEASGVWEYRLDQGEGAR